MGIVILIIILIIISIGLYGKKATPAEIEAPIDVDKVNKEKKIQLLRESWERLLIEKGELISKIERLVRQKAQIEELENFILIRARIGITILILIINFFYLKSVIDEKDHSVWFLGEITDVNGFILLLYSIIGYITYGSVKKLVLSLKAKIFASLHEYHFDTIEDMESAQKLLVLINEDIIEVEKELELLSRG